MGARGKAHNMQRESQKSSCCFDENAERKCSKVKTPEKFDLFPFKFWSRANQDIYSKACIHPNFKSLLRTSNEKCQTIIV